VIDLEAMQLCHELLAAGFTVWRDKEPLATQDWKLEIRRTIQDSVVVVACFLASSLGAQHSLKAAGCSESQGTTDFSE